LVAYNENGGYFVPYSSRHRPVAQRILAGRVHDEVTLALIAERCGTGDVVHAGTYFGDFLPALSKVCRGTVWAFEPNPENHRCATITLAINGLTNVHLQHAGLGEAAGSLHLRVRDRTGRSLGGGSRFVQGAHTGTVEVAVVRIDDVVPEDREVSVIQLDVEGFEGPALMGARNTIRRCKPVLILEDVPSADLLPEEVTALGYEVMARCGRNTAYGVP